MKTLACVVFTPVHLAAKLALNYLTPFIVSNAGLVAHRRL